MSMSIGLGGFFLGVTAFDLCCPDEGNLTPCLIRVGPRRFLERKLDVENCYAHCYYYLEGALVCENGLPITFTTRRGMPYFDAAAFLTTLSSDVRPCSSEHYHWKRNSRLSDITQGSDLGLCTSSCSWLDIDVYHVNLLYTPGALTICGRQVEYIGWESFDPECYVGNDRVRELIRKSLEQPHDLDAGDILPLLPQGNDFWFNEMTISAEHLSIHLVRSLGNRISIRLYSDTCSKKLPSRSPREDLELILKLMQQPDLESMKALLP